MSWLNEPFTYADYIAKIIQDNYADKPSEEKRRLFMKISSAHDRIEAFPKWKNENIECCRKKEVEDEKRKKLKYLWDNKPTICEHCGKSIEIKNKHDRCDSCGYDIFLSEKRMKWEFFEHKSLAPMLNSIKLNSFYDDKKQ